MAVIRLLVPELQLQKKFLIPRILRSGLNHTMAYLF